MLVGATLRYESQGILSYKVENDGEGPSFSYSREIMKGVFISAKKILCRMRYTNLFIHQLYLSGYRSKTLV